MAIFHVDLSLPNTLYHGTSIGAIEGIRRQPINSRYWRGERDFGCGLYTTIDLYQATRWARKPIAEAVEANMMMEHGDILIPAIPPEELPAVAVLECKPEVYTDDVSVVDFRGECREWAEFILRHRFDSGIHRCNCPRHADIVCGLMADNNTGQVIKEFRAKRRMDNEEDLLWFWKQIVLSKEGRVLNGLELGDQIAFFDERLNSMLQLKGYYIYNPLNYINDVNPNNYRWEWDLYDATGSPYKEDESRL